MGSFNLFLQDRLIFELLYTALILFFTLSIYVKASRFYSLSSHKGFRFFGNAFLSFAVAYAIRFAIGLVEGAPYAWILSILAVLMSIAFFYTICLFGFYLVYSLVWKEQKTREYILHVAALAIAILSVLFGSEFMFVSQLAVLAYASVVSYDNYLKDRRKIQQLYFIAMVLGFAGFLANSLLPIISEVYPPFVIYVYAITVSIFLIIFYCVTGRWLKEND
ncbi:MAG: hypothetical protein ABH879_03160 [archaeon]